MSVFPGTRGHSLDETPSSLWDAQPDTTLASGLALSTDDVGTQGGSRIVRREEHRLGHQISPGDPITS